MNKSVYLALIGATVAQKTPFMKHRLANLHKRKLEHEENFEATTMEWDEP